MRVGTGKPLAETSAAAAELTVRSDGAMKLGVCLCAVKQVPVTMNEMLLRGCTLRNTGHILGLVVYTGDDSRIQMNAAKTSNKVGKQWAAEHMHSLEALN